MWFVIREGTRVTQFFGTADIKQMEELQNFRNEGELPRPMSSKEEYNYLVKPKACTCYFSYFSPNFSP